MHDLGPLVGNARVLDLVFPGTHDTLTADLSDRIADNANDISPRLAKILHDLAPQELIGSFIRDQATSQALYVTELLQAGTRFFDFRITYTKGPHLGEPYDWYGLHFVETKAKALTYLKTIIDWLNSPEGVDEIVVVWFSRHGDTCETGTNQYPGVSVAEKQAFWASIKSVIGPLLINASDMPPNATSVDTCRDAGQRVLVYTSDWKEFTGSDPAPLNACRHIANLHNGDFLNETIGYREQLDAYRGYAEQRQIDAATNIFSLVRLAVSSPDFQIEAAAKLRYIPFGHAEVRAKCASGFNLPNVTEWCPETLLDLTQLANYYSQLTLEIAHNSPGYAFPNAFYVDAVTSTGGIRTGTTPLNQPPGPQPHALSEYAYVATVVDWFRAWRCSTASALPDVSSGQSIADLCASAGAALATLRAAAPIQTWSDPASGRLDGWPAPGRLPGH